MRTAFIRSPILSGMLALALGACSAPPAQAPSQLSPSPSKSSPVAMSAPDAGNTDQSRFGVIAGQSPSPLAAPSGGGGGGTAPDAAATKSASPAPVASPPPIVAHPWDPAQFGARLIAFASTRIQGSLGGFDVYLFDPITATVYAIPAANSPADEVHPRLSANGRWLVFSTNLRGNFDIMRYDLQNQIVDPLVNLNTVADELSPSIDDSGNVLAYLGVAAGVSQVRLFDLKTNVANIPAPVAALQARPLTPQISGDGHWIAFSATDGRGADIYLYRIGDTAVSSPPFINSPADDVDPWLSEDGQRLLFASNRKGSFDLYQADLVSGFTDNLALANSPGNDREPRFMGPADQDIVFQSDRSVYETRILLFHPSTGVIDTLPVMHEPGEDDILGNGFTAGPVADVPLPADDLFGFGGLYRRSGPIFGRRGF